MQKSTNSDFSQMKGQVPPAPETASEDFRLSAKDGYSLAATLTGDPASPKLAVINSAMAVPRRYYKHFAAALAARGYAVLTWDYRGVAGSAPARLRGFEARLRDYVLLDMEAVIDWARARNPGRLVLVGHSLGGQLAGLLENPSDIDAMATFSSQSGHWRLQGGEQKLTVALHLHLTLPVLSTVFGYLPWSYIGGAEDIPKDVALEWARWGRHRDYLLGDTTLPLERFQAFTAPVLAWSIADDKWGTARSVDAMMRAYPNLERRHLAVAGSGLKSIGHFGYFRPTAQHLWRETFDWLDGAQRPS